ncbi:protein-L-isoaspartate O-methyltransferase family protein [Arenibaculum pallidiluteum]|uniref:protein-L-isoaspartate O-methyltransferase family protein n=1 Tax=Arenibaculum pallidiluteum TaxID=2812559 RepID=UPI001A972D49|nr:methyltransferase domain-containing protein [Arenibaculum pallidiluteum]
MTPQELAIVRRAYARQVMAADRPVTDARIEEAFARVPREDFLGPGPWPVFRFWRNGYAITPDADPVHLYTNDIVGIAPERGINNGQPSLHAHLLACAAPRDGEHLVHVGAGVGYFTAIMAHLVGPSGRVTAIELEPDLAARARANLAGFVNVAVIEGDGSAAGFDPADVIYVNAGATHPADAWLDGLRERGRLVLPLTTDRGFGAGDPAAIHRRGAVFVITRQHGEFAARWISPVAIYPCAGLRDAESERALAAAFAKGPPTGVARLIRISGEARDVPDALAEDRCWLRAPGWALACG